MNKSALSSFAKSLRFADSLVENSEDVTFNDCSSLNLDEDDDDGSPDIPDVNERLAYLKPSRQLLEFYRKKFAEQDCEHASLVDMLEGYKHTYAKQHGIEWNLRQREEEISELQKALSEIQVSLFQEREQVLRLYAENDRYKIKDLSSRRVIKQLLEEGGHKIEEESTNFVPDLRKKGRATTVTKSRKLDNYQLVVNSQPPGEDDRVAREALHSQIENLQEKLESRTRDFKELIESKLQERQKLSEEYYYLSEKDMDKVKTATEKLYKTQELLYLSAEDILSLRQQARAQEREWMVQKDKLLRELDSVKERLHIDQPTQTKKVVLNVSNKDADASHRQQQELQKLREDVAYAQHFQEMYREQVISLEDDLARLREQDDLKSDDFNDKVGKIGQRYKIMKTRFEDLEKRRNLEVEGFKNDIKALRKRLKDMQQQLFKVTLSKAESLLDESRPPDLDLAVLKNIRSTAKHNTKIKGGLNNLKLRIHELEKLSQGY